MTASKSRPVTSATLREKSASGTYPVARESSGERAGASGAAQDPFLAIVAHDLRAPLSAVLTAAHVLLRREDLGDAARRSVHRILRSGDRMRRLVEQLLDAERARQPGGLRLSVGEARDLRSTVARIVDEVQGHHADRRITQRDAGPVLAEFDEGRMEQVIANLVGNAVVHGASDRAVEVQVDADEASAWIYVHNYGPPIPPELRRVLFDPFQRARCERRGSDGLGLGLYIAERIMTAHRGCLSVSSTEKDGTRFVASFPRWFAA